MITEHTKRVWDVFNRKWREVNPDRHEYLVQARLPRTQTWSIGHSPEHAAAEGTGPLGWWLAVFNGSLIPVTASPHSCDLS
jgi:hypothetical protein